MFGGRGGYICFVLYCFPDKTLLLSSHFQTYDSEVCSPTRCSHMSSVHVEEGVSRSIATDSLSDFLCKAELWLPGKEMGIDLKMALGTAVADRPSGAPVGWKA